jgi:hypothetical protein
MDVSCLNVVYGKKSAYTAGSVSLLYLLPSPFVCETFMLEPEHI